MTSPTKIPELAYAAEQRREFALWAEAYDESPNPMLALEERYLDALLPEVHDKDVVDVGCGTGRWLGRLAAREPGSLKGIDFSPEMLARARQKLGRRALLAVGHATSLPIASQSADVVFASFLLSYVSDLSRFAEELRRCVRPGGSVHISDMHPDTALRCGWKRSFRAGEMQVELTAFHRSLPELIACFRKAGFEVTCLLEPSFGPPELDIFRFAGKLGAYDAVAGLPAIYILQLRRASSGEAAQPHSGVIVCGARIALDAATTIEGNVRSANGKIASLTSKSQSACPLAETSSIDIAGYLLLPGLINAHDHLEFGLYPNLGRGGYRNSGEWAHDIQSKDVGTIQAHQGIPRDVRLWWGALRNLLCGVTTVCHHNPLHSELLSDDFPVRVVTDFGWAHSPSMDPALPQKFLATPLDAPFVIHACEGVDDTAAREIFELDALGTLDQRTVLVHGLALGAEGIELLNKRRAALVWCPSSNRFLYGHTHTLQAITSVETCLLGSDSPLTAAGDLLDELRIAHQEVGVDAGRLYHMLLGKAAAVLRLRDGRDGLRPDASADFIALRDRGETPAGSLVSATYRDVELVVVRGRVQLASDEMVRRLPAEQSAGLSPIEVESIVRWVRAPLPRMFREAQKVLGAEIKLGGRRVRHVATAWL